jgi:hypothetical protein
MKPERGTGIACIGRRNRILNSSEVSQTVPFRSLAKVSRRPPIAFGYGGEVMWSGLFECASEERIWTWGLSFVFRGLHPDEILIRLGEGVYVWSGILKLVLGRLHFSFLERMVIQIGKFKWHDSLLIVFFLVRPKRPIVQKFCFGDNKHLISAKFGWNSWRGEWLSASQRTSLVC